MSLFVPSAAIERRARELRAANLAFNARYPGEAPGRQPVHTVYGGGQLFRAGTVPRLGEVARAALAEFAPDAAALDAALGLGRQAEAVHARITAKLLTEPVEDFRIDFEDGYGNRPDAEEDRDVAAAAREVASAMEAGTLSPFIGIRIKPLNEELRGRSLRTLQLFIATLLDRAGRLPDHFVVTLPKITAPGQVRAFAEMLAILENELGLGRARSGSR